MFKNIDQYGNKTAIIDEANTKYTYNELKAYSDKMVKNIPSRSICAIICDNTFESVCFYVGCIRKKIVLLLLPPNITDANVLKYIEQYRINYLLSNKHIPIINNIYNNRTTYGKSILYNTKSEQSIVNPDLALLLSTSGSSGNSKLVKLSYKNIYINTIDIIHRLPMTSSDSVITTMPFSYSYGLSIINTHLYIGATIVLNTSHVYEKKFKDSLISNKVTTLGGVPFLYEILDKFNILDDDNLSIKYITQAGGACNTKLKEKLLDLSIKRNFEIYIMYGQTEATARISILPYNELKRHIDSVGYPMNSGSVKILPNTNLESDNIGEIVYIGPNVMMGYATKLNDLSVVDNISELHTGDIGYLDEAGRIYIVGRKSRFVKIRGIRISLDSIEDYFAEKNITVIAFYRNDKIYILSKTDIINFLSNLSYEFSIKPYDICHIVVSDFIRNQNNKIDYNWYNNYPET